MNMNLHFVCPRVELFVNESQLSLPTRLRGTENNRKQKAAELAEEVSLVYVRTFQGCHDGIFINVVAGRMRYVPTHSIAAI